ncbi:hypothetical protein P5673_014855 [Acropora cervicornis]|uniref:Uncharacterized protein n=1 Tax=Acropora cervicornis TaxID=6130 RepID=A0AAD9V638_ACRCE|nr:hypothetical protein P5673_014855 [Acropora cervicornis]
MVKTCFNYDLICATYGREHAHLRDDKRSKELYNTTLLYSRIKFRCQVNIVLKIQNPALQLTLCDDIKPFLFSGWSNFFKTASISCKRLTYILRQNDLAEN